MRLFGGRSHDDREHLVQTLRSLGPTSVGGLSAALSWSPRRTERAVREAARWGNGAIDYDPRTGRVAFLRLAPPAPAPSPSVPAPPPPSPRRSDAASPPPLPRSWGASAKCPTCEIPYVSTGSGAGVYCPQCGRLSYGPSGSVGAGSQNGAADATVRPPSLAPATTLGEDRRSQELFAAWVTARPMPCPKCRTTLRHKGIGQYACPACGAQVAFEAPAGGLASPARIARPPSSDRPEDGPAPPDR